MSGPARIPTGILKLRNSWRAKKRAATEPKARPATRTPAPPRHLDDMAKEQWRKIAPLLIEMRVLSDMDTEALALYCTCYSRWRQAEKQLAEDGIIVKAPSGYPIQHPALAIATKAIDQMATLLARFGMTPADRSRVHVETPRVSDKYARFVREGYRDEHDAYEALRESAAAQAG